MTAQPWSVERHRGSAAAFHGREVPEPAVRSLWWFQVGAPAVVLGSTQELSAVDRAAAQATGTEVVRRRSGGGAVHLVPEGSLWLDVVVPRGDPLWDDDVHRSFHWLGRVWAAALEHLGVHGAVVHEGPMVKHPWSSAICFAGLGPGEVTVDGAKVVGISQRRTRAASRLQSVLLLDWQPAALIDLLALDSGQAAAALGAVERRARGIGPRSPAQVEAAVAAALADLRP